MENEMNWPPRFCTSCQVMRTVEGGVWVKIERGKRQRWVCQWCMAKRGATAAGTAPATQKASGAVSGIVSR
jgi:hypothetical protein